jgi:thioredoxin-dependent peroxiredoxin
MLKTGDKAPAWKAPDQHGALRSSSDFPGWILLYFYPKDDTPGCTIEACGFRDSYEAFKDRVSIVGVSKDDVASHKAFADKYKLPFTLVADTDMAIIKAFGADGLLLPKRVTFLIDPQGVIRKIYHGFDCNDHAADIRKDLESFGL